MKQVTLGDISTLLTRGKAPQYQESGTGKIVKSAQVQPKAILWSKCPSVSGEFAQKFKKNFALRNDDILLNGTGTGTLGRPGFVKEIPDGIYIPDSHVNLIRINTTIASSRFVFHWLNSSECQKKIALASTGSTNQIELSADRLSKIAVPLPPLVQQIHIAQVLDQADRLRQQDRQLLAHYDQLVQAVFVEMFGDPVRNEKGWPVKTVGEQIEFLTSGSRGWAAYYSESGSKFLRIQNLVKGQLRLDDIAYVNAPSTAEAKRTRVKAGDVLLSITADLGRTAFIPQDFGEAYISQHLALLRFNSEVHSNYASQLLTSDFGQRQIIKANKGGVKAGLNFDDVKSIKLLVPPYQLQQKFAEIVAQIEAQKTATQQLQAQSEALFQSLLQQAFRGELAAPQPTAAPPAGQLAFAL